MRFRATALTAMSLYFLIVCCASAGTVPRILIVGDSWAASIATTAYDPVNGTAPGFASFDNALVEAGLGGYKTRGDKTAWGGRKATDWIKPENLARITSELHDFPSIDTVYLVIGGNDFLGLAAYGTNIMSYSPTQRAAYWQTIRNNIQTIVNHCLAQRPDVKVILADYDYLDPVAAAAAYGFDFAGATQRQVNDAFVELGRQKLAIAQSTERCEYVDNWGVLQNTFAFPAAGLPLPGAAPDYSPYTGGNLDAGMPPAASVGDGVHPNDAGHRPMLQRAIEQYLRNWLTKSGEQPDSDDDGLKDIDETRDLDPNTPGTQNPFNPNNPDSTGDFGTLSGDGKLDGLNDFDGDGQTNAEEFAKGSNPVDSESHMPVGSAGVGAAVTALVGLSGRRILKAA